jgi:hypothetical protein
VSGVTIVAAVTVVVTRFRMSAMAGVNAVAIRSRMSAVP